MPFTGVALEAMGFATIVQKGSFKAKFFKLNLYKVQGVQIDEPLIQSRRERISGCSCVIALSNNPEDSIRELIGEDWAALNLQQLIAPADKSPILGILIEAEDYIECEQGRKDER